MAEPKKHGERSGARYYMRVGSPRHSCGRIGSERSQERGLKGDAETGYERLLRSPPATACTVVQLRPGGLAAPLFLFPGVGCELNELHHLVRNLTPGRAIYGLQIDFPLNGSSLAATVEEMAMQAVAEIKAIQPTGPQHLAGYSFGGLVAFAASQLICQAGGEVGLLALIGTPIAQRFWPVSLFFTSLATRTRRQLAILVRLPVEAALHFIVGRAVKLGRLMLQRLSPNFMVAPATPLGVAPQLDRGKVAMEKYRPGFYPGTITLLQAADE